MENNSQQPINSQTSQQPAPPTNQTPPPPPQSKKSFPWKWILILSVIIILVIIGVASLFVVVPHNSTTPTPTPALVAQAPTPTPDPTADPDLIKADWQTYSNEEYGFEFKYPKTFFIEKNTNPIFVKNKNGIYMEILGQEGEAGITSFNKVYNQPDGHVTSSANYFSTEYGEVNTFKETKISNFEIQGYKAVKWKNEIFVKNPPRIVVNIGVSVLTDNYNISVWSTNRDQEDAELNKLFDQILSTFKFTDGPTNTTSQPLVTVSTVGGLCADGNICSTNYQILSDGKVLLNNEEYKKLAPSTITHLEDQVTSTDFNKIKANKFTDTCPTAYDGQEVTYVFHTKSVNETIPSCTYNLDEKEPIFILLNNLLKK